MDRLFARARLRGFGVEERECHRRGGRGVTALDQCVQRLADAVGAVERESDLLRCLESGEPGRLALFVRVLRIDAVGDRLGVAIRDRQGFRTFEDLRDPPGKLRLRFVRHSRISVPTLVFVTSFGRELAEKADHPCQLARLS